MVKSKHWKTGKFRLDTLRTWTKYPVEVSSRVVNLVKTKSRRNYNPEHISYTLNLFWSEVAQMIKENNDDGCVVFLDNLGSFMSYTHDKVVRVTKGQDFIKYGCKRIRFAFAGKFKRTCYRLLNRDNKVVTDYLDEKSKNRQLAKKWFGIKKGNDDENGSQEC